MCACTHKLSPAIVICMPPATVFVLRFVFQTNWWPAEVPMLHIAPRGWGLEEGHNRHTRLISLHPLVHAKHHSLLIDQPAQRQLIANPQQLMFLLPLLFIIKRGIIFVIGVNDFISERQITFTFPSRWQPWFNQCVQKFP